MLQYNTPFGDTTNGTIPVWHEAAITYVDANDHTKGWTAEFDTSAIDWQIGTYVQARFGDAPLPAQGAVPEPATLALFGLGLGGLALARRRRK